MVLIEVSGRWIRSRTQARRVGLSIVSSRTKALSKGYSPSATSRFSGDCSESWGQDQHQERARSGHDVSVLWPVSAQGGIGCQASGAGGRRRRRDGPTIAVDLEKAGFEVEIARRHPCPREVPQKPTDVVATDLPMKGATIGSLGGHQVGRTNDASDRDDGLRRGGERGRGDVARRVSRRDQAVALETLRRARRACLSRTGLSREKVLLRCTRRRTFPSRQPLGSCSPMRQRRALHRPDLGRDLSASIPVEKGTGKGSLRSPSTRAGRVWIDRSWRSTAPPCRRTCSKASSRARAGGVHGRGDDPARAVRGGLTGGRCSWTRS